MEMKYMRIRNNKNVVRLIAAPGGVDELVEVEF